MGVAISRKAILGGRCVDTNEQLGAPLTPLVDTFLAVGGVFGGLEMCMGKEDEYKACNRVNGMLPYSTFLVCLFQRRSQAIQDALQNDTNTPDFLYEGRNLFVLRSDADRVLGRKCGREVCGRTAYANRTLEFNALDHGDLLFDLKDLQLSLLNCEFVHLCSVVMLSLATHKNESDASGSQSASLNSSSASEGRAFSNRLTIAVVAAFFIFTLTFDQ